MTSNTVAERVNSGIGGSCEKRGNEKAAVVWGQLQSVAKAAREAAGEDNPELLPRCTSCGQLTALFDMGPAGWCIPCERGPVTVYPQPCRWCGRDMAAETTEVVWSARRAGCCSKECVDAVAALTSRRGRPCRWCRRDIALRRPSTDAEREMVRIGFCSVKCGASAEEHADEFYEDMCRAAREVE